MKLITKICLKLEYLGQIVISTSMVYFHKYFINKKELKTEKESLISIAGCILIATKTCNKLINMEKLIKNMLESYLEQEKGLISIITEKIIKELMEEIKKEEIEILIKIGFELDVDMPYNYLKEIKKYLMTYYSDNSSKLLQLLYYYINDSFILPLCLNYHPKLIAISCLYLLFQFLKIDLKNSINGTIWYKIIDSDYNYDEIEQLSNLISIVYKPRNDTLLCIIFPHSSNKLKVDYEYSDFLNVGKSNQYSTLSTHLND